MENLLMNLFLSISSEINGEITYYYFCENCKKQWVSDIDFKECNKLCNKCENSNTQIIIRGFENMKGFGVKDQIYKFFGNNYFLDIFINKFYCKKCNKLWITLKNKSVNFLCDNCEREIKNNL